MKYLTHNQILLIPDIHQNLWFANKILEVEDFDHVVFMGDYLDSRNPVNDETHFNVKKVCQWLNEKHKELGDKATWLCGNHDVAYLASYTPKYTRTKLNPMYVCSGWTRRKATDFNKNIDKEWIDGLELCCKVGDYTVSHAGFHFKQGWVSNLSVEENIEKMYQKWEETKSSFMYTDEHWIWDVGRCRGGISNVGSPVWMDWNREFEPQDELKQIVGHTTSYEPHAPKGENFCIDVMQTCYGIVINGELTIKYLFKYDL